MKQVKYAEPKCKTGKTVQLCLFLKWYCINNPLDSPFSTNFDWNMEAGGKGLPKKHRDTVSLIALDLI